MNSSKNTINPSILIDVHTIKFPFAKGGRKIPLFGKEGKGEI
jgi:hypothetical protein